MPGVIVEEQNDNQEPVSSSPTQGWKDQLPTDIKDSPLLKSYENTPEGMNNAFKGYLGLEKLLGRDKIPVPKDENDTEAWVVYNKAMGVPDKPEGYELADSNLPDSMKKFGLDKTEFATVMMQNRIPKNAVNGLWKAYQQKNIDAINKSIQQQKEQLNNSINQLRSEWGDAYNVNVELGQQVINKFSFNKEENDWLTAMLTSSPVGIKFLARVGDQFAENKIPEFQLKKFTMTPENAQEEINSMTKDLDGPYHNQKGRFTDREHQEAVKRVNLLYSVKNRNNQ